MPLSISDDHKNQLRLLQTQDTHVVKEFCRLATLFLKQEVNPRVFSSAANKLGVQPLQVEESIQALVFLLSQSSQTSLSQTDFKELAASLGFAEDAAQALTDTYTENELELKEYLKRMGVQFPNYQNLEWRFDILVGSRTLHHIAEPLIMLQLSLDRGSHQETKDSTHDLRAKDDNFKSDKLLLQTDPNNLVHMTTVLEEALQEARTHHSRRVHRHFK